MIDLRVFAIVASLALVPVAAAQDDWEDEPTPEEKILGQEIMAIVCCKSIAGAEREFLKKDKDGNKTQDYWVGDVHALQFLCPSPDGKAAEPEPSLLKGIRLIGEELARADSAPLTIPGLFKAPPAKPEPKKGYLYSAMAKYETDGEPKAYDDGTHRNATKFGFCALPVVHGKDGKQTFIVGEDGVVWAKDTGGKPPAAFPADPLKAGWTRKNG